MDYAAKNIPLGFSSLFDVLLERSKGLFPSKNSKKN
jgi:hypothetical protein